MSYKTARDQIVHIFENDVSGTSDVRGQPGSWTEDRGGSWDSPLQAGRFRVRCVASAFNAASSYGEPRFFKDIEVKRGYSGAWADTAELDEVRWADEGQIVRALRDTTNWDVSTSCIVSMSPGGAEMLPADPDDETNTVTTSIALEHY